jgi:GNAT superfamily N-acetyltransferase
MGFNYVAATQSTLVTQERLAAGMPFVARSDDGIIGTITYYPKAQHKNTEPDLYQDKDIGHFGQFAVSPEMQKHGIGDKLVKHVERITLVDGKRELACDTAEGAIELIDFYTRRGYKPIGYHRWGHACYRSIILCKTLGPNRCMIPTYHRESPPNAGRGRFCHF